jgi:hypothetical protein
MIEAYRAELDAPLLPLRVGSKGMPVRRTQEWLGLHGVGVEVDGDFGPATERAVRTFAPLSKGMVDAATWQALVSPLAHAASISVPAAGFGPAVVTLARACLDAEAREAGGDNRGPWVRHFCRGYEVAWCQGFASTVWAQAARATGLPSPLELELDGVWCLYVPRLVTEARRAGRFLDGRQLGRDVTPGSMFFLRGGAAGYLHVGIVVRRDGDTFESIEGNTNTDGSANGYEVARRFRRVESCDFAYV